MGWLGDGVRGGGGVLSKKGVGVFLETWHSERARFYFGRRGYSPSFLENLALWLRPVLDPSPLGSRDPAPPGRGYPGPASGASSRPYTRQCGAGPAPGG